ncbi:ABC transporter permease [Ideonella sp.]|uniref:ABC transporter permease n=1 Tax=Ideonella sp. TaxID=1929293 RepID=UPI002B46FA5A|nr:ABC transporter permease [Ideonella sp.]HJV71499.1 ABC transporter permease [Ideonella sp.]
MLWTLAVRNVLRNRRRSAITVLAVAIGLAALTFLWGFVDGMNQQMVHNTTRYFAGDVQVHRRGYHEDPNLDRAFDDGGRLLEAVRADPAVAAASLRLESKALASRGDKSRGVMVFGIDPEAESRVTDLFKAVVGGSALRGADDAGVLVGEQLADTLGAQAGDELVFVGQAYDGSVASARLPVRGVYRTQIDELDGYVAVVPMAVMREFLAAPGAATAVALRLRDRGALEAASAGLARRLGPTYEVVGWPVLLPMVAVSVRYHEVTGYVVLTIFFVMVAAGVANPVLMAVLERTREFGIMLALGTSPGRLLRLVLCEAMLLGAAGLLAGNLLGLGITASFSRRGIDLSAFGAGLRVMPGLADIIYPVVRMERSLVISALVFAIAFLVALYPAIKAATLEPVAAIRGIDAAAAGRWRRGAARPVSTRWPVFALIATRNLRRNRKRSAITIGGTAFAILSYVFLYGYFDGFGEQIADNATRYVTGHVQIERAGLRRDWAPELAFGDADALLARFAALPGVRAAAPRVQAQALASSAAKSEGIMLIGVDPERERGVTFIDRTIVQGAPLDPTAGRDIVIGRGLADKLGLRLGEKLVVMAPALGGELGTAAYRVRGIFATESSAFDRTMAFVTLPAAQALLGLGPRVSSINLRLAERDGVAPVLARLGPALGEAGLAATPWQVLMPQVSQMVGLIRAIRSVVVGVFFVVVALAVMNTVFMAVAERTREFGVMMALGTSPRAIVRMVVYETAALMALASVLGYAGGAVLVLYLGNRGMDLSAFFKDYSAIPGLTGMAYPRLVVASIAGPGVALFVAGVAVSLYPAMRAARLDPSIAIRHP